MHVLLFQCDYCSMFINFWRKFDVVIKYQLNNKWLNGKININDIKFYEHIMQILYKHSLSGELF